MSRAEEDERHSRERYAFPHRHLNNLRICPVGNLPRDTPREGGQKLRPRQKKCEGEGGPGGGVEEGGGEKEGTIERVRERESE